MMDEERFLELREELGNTAFGTAEQVKAGLRNRGIDANEADAWI